MQKGDMGIPRCASIDSQTERMVFRNTEVIRSSFIHEDEGTGGNSVPSIRRNHIESGLQLCFEWRRVFGTLAVLDVDTRSEPFHDSPSFVTKRHLAWSSNRYSPSARRTRASASSGSPLAKAACHF